MKANLNKAVIAVGSNIDPAINIDKACQIISTEHKLLKKSTFTKTKPQGLTDQPDFLNGAFYIETTLDKAELKKYLTQVESKLGRIRTENKNGPRTIDLDVSVFNGKIIDHDFYMYDFVRKAVTEIMPELNKPKTSPSSET